MKITWLISALLLLSPAVMAQSISGKPFIAAQGQAKVEVVPDIFRLKVTLADTGMDAAKTQEHVETLAEAVVDTAARMNIADKDIELRNLSIEAVEEWDEKSEKEVFKGNRYERVVNLSFHSLEALKAFIGELPKGKEVQVDTGTFSYSKEQAAVKALMQEAMSDARATADAVAAALGKKIIGVHNVSDTPQSGSYFRGYGATSNVEGITVTGGASIARNVPPPAKLVLKEGTLTLTRVLYVIYLLEP